MTNIIKSIDTICAIHLKKQIHIHPFNEEVARVGMTVASGAMKYEELIARIRENSVGVKQLDRRQTRYKQTTRSAIFTFQAHFSIESKDF